MLEQEFLGFINDNKLFASSDRILLAVSGGIDSMVMAELFHRISQPFAIAHVNFGLRNTESDQDALFVENKAQAYGVPFHLVRFDTAAEASQRGISIQMAARELRYAWFSQLIDTYQYAYVATAHHLNDVLETLLLNLTRGTGLAGLHGISASHNRLVRPLLFATRDQLATYSNVNEITYREDSSNKEDKYARNRIRHHVVPVLASLNSGLWQTFPKTVERLRAAETLMLTELARSWEFVARRQGQQTLLLADALLSLSEPVFRLTEWLKPYGFTAEQAARMIAILEQPVGQVFLSETHRVSHERNGLVLEPLRSVSTIEIVLNNWPVETVNVANQYQLTFERLENPTSFMPDPNPEVAFFDATTLAFPLTIRTWRQGDRFRPLGMNGHKLVSDFLNDLKLSRTEREQTAVLCSGDEIAWIIGRRIAHKFRIKSNTHTLTRIVVLR